MSKKKKREKKKREKKKKKKKDKGVIAIHFQASCAEVYNMYSERSKT